MTYSTQCAWLVDADWCWFFGGSLGNGDVILSRPTLLSSKVHRTAASQRLDRGLLLDRGPFPEAVATLGLEPPRARCVVCAETSAFFLSSFLFHGLEMGRGGGGCDMRSIPAPRDLPAVCVWPIANVLQPSSTYSTPSPPCTAAAAHIAGMQAELRCTLPRYFDARDQKSTIVNFRGKHNKI